jgi:hypothetical protein
LVPTRDIAIFIATACATWVRERTAEYAEGSALTRGKTIERVRLSRKKDSHKEGPKNLREAIIRAAEQTKEDNGLVGYLSRLARTEPKSFAALFGRIPPDQIIGKGALPHVRTVIKKDLRDCGIIFEGSLKS